MTVEDTQSFSTDPPFVRLEVLDIPAIANEHASRVGVYLSACVPDARYPFTGCTVIESSDAGVSWHRLAYITNEGWIGTITTMTSIAVSPDMWDDANTITVEMDNGQLESVTDLQVLNGANRILIGEEIVAFGSAELVDTATYELSHLLRGCRGTEAKITTHIDFERAVLLNAQGIYFVDLPPTAIGTDRMLKALAPGAIQEEVEALDVSYGAKTVLPFAPVNVRATRDGSNNVAVAWTRRSRHMFNPLTQGAPVGERWEEYDLEHYDLAGATLKRTRANIAVGSPHGLPPVPVYSAAQQTTDGYTPGDPITVKVYQRSEQFGRGAVVEATV